MNLLMCMVALVSMVVDREPIAAVAIVVILFHEIIRE